MEKLLTFLRLAVFCHEISASSGVTTRKYIYTDKAPGHSPHSSQAVQVDNIVFVTASLGSRLDGTLVDGITNQTTKAFENLGYVLSAANSSFGSVVQATVLLTDMKFYGAMNEVYANYFTSKFPTRMAYQVVKLPKDALVSVEVVAISGDIVEC